MTVVRGSWFPASIRLPGGVSYARARVVLGQGGEHAGLWVFRRAGVAAWHGLVDWVGTPPIPVGRQARNGVTVRLVTGEVAVVTPGSGCRCGELGRWAGPDWARTTAA